MSNMFQPTQSQLEELDKTIFAEPAFNFIDQFNASLNDQDVSSSGTLDSPSPAPSCGSSIPSYSTSTSQYDANHHSGDPQYPSIDQVGTDQAAQYLYTFPIVEQDDDHISVNLLKEVNENQSVMSGNHSSLGFPTTVEDQPREEPAFCQDTCNFASNTSLATSVFDDSTNNSAFWMDESERLASMSSKFQGTYEQVQQDAQVDHTGHFNENPFYNANLTSNMLPLHPGFNQTAQHMIPVSVKSIFAGNSHPSVSHQTSQPASIQHVEQLGVAGKMAASVPVPHSGRGKKRAREPATEDSVTAGPNTTDLPPPSKKRPGAQIGQDKNQLKHELDAHTMPPDCELTVEEIRTFCPRWTERPVVQMRFVRNNVSAITEAGITCANRISVMDAGTMEKTSTKRRSKMSVKEYRETARAAKSRGEPFPEDPNFGTKHWGEHHGEPNHDIPALDLVNGVKYFPVGAGAGIYTQCLEFLWERQDWTVMQSQIGALAQALGFTMPAEDGNRDTNANKRFEDLRKATRKAQKQAEAQIQAQSNVVV